MISPEIVIEIVLAYLLVLFAISYWVEHKYATGTNLTNNPMIYTLALAIYCTAWTFYGNVGMAATDTYLFLGVYTGPALFFIFWREILKKLVRIKNEYNVTSIADFISTRYGKSSVVAAIVSLIALVGVVPYLSIQLKAIFTSYSIITTGKNISSAALNPIEMSMLLVIIVFVIFFGLRKLDQSERHPGMVMAIAIQSVVKLIAFMAVGIFVTYFLYDGFGDIMRQIGNNEINRVSQESNFPSYSLFLSYIVLSFFAIIFLPRQFHMAVVENTDEKHIRMASWFLPLYFIAITIFAFPIAMAGILKGYDVSMADTFILLLPLRSGNSWLSFLVFIGGFSAALSMLMISAMTITTMTANYLVMPVLGRIKGLGFFRKKLLLVRWILITLIMFTAYLFEVKIGSSYVLVKIGMISFAAVLQFAPAAIGALFWEKGNKIGAISGLTAGFMMWIYTSLVPAIAKSGWISMAILENGPFGVNFLRPEHLFGVVNMDALAQVVIFSMFFNVGFYVLGSLAFQKSEQEKQITNDFFAIIRNHASISKNNHQQSDQVDLKNRIKTIESIFGKYVNTKDSKELTQSCLEKTGLTEKKTISINELIELNNTVEKTLSRYIGAPSASEELSKESLFTSKEKEYLADIYAQMAVDLKLTPKEFAEKISYYKEKENFLTSQQSQLESLVKEKTSELEEKIAELKQWQHISINRELKMVELKEKNALLDNMKKN